MYLKSHNFDFIRKIFISSIDFQVFVYFKFSLPFSKFILKYCTIFIYFFNLKSLKIL